jgi:hypothetical protein
MELTQLISPIFFNSFTDNTLKIINKTKKQNYKLFHSLDKRKQLQ